MAPLLSCPCRMQGWTVSPVPPPPMFEAESDLASQKDAFAKERAFVHAEVQRVQKRLAQVGHSLLPRSPCCHVVFVVCFQPAPVPDARSITGCSLHRSTPAS